MRVIEKMATLALMSLLVNGSSAGAAGKSATADKIPITTKSEEARKLYLKGRDLTEKLRATDAHKAFEEALAKDKTFALAAFGLANTAASAREFFAETAHAVELAGNASEAEQLMIRGFDAGARGQPNQALELENKLVALVPNDERAHNLLGGLYFGRQEYDKAIAEYEKAVKINPKFSQPYNQLGYAYRFVEKYPQAEKTFKQYIALIPDDPNPYDSYAELLMKTGRFDESIKSYEKAIAVDPNFISAYVGIGNNQMFLGRGADARATFGKLMGVARNDGEKRQALFWTAVSYTHEGQPDQAIGEAKKEAAIAEAGNDRSNLAFDHNLMGNILLEFGRTDEALAQFNEGLDIMSKAEVPAEVNEQFRRNHSFDLARVALAKKDLAGAKSTAETYAKAVGEKKVPFEVRQLHELNGMIAIEDKRLDAAVAELQQANQQDPRVLYLLAVALSAKGDAVQARTYCTKAADFNGLSGNYGYVRKKAKDLLGHLAG